MKVMSFNIRVNEPGDEPYTFEKRLPGIIRLIEEEKPLIIGFQEVRDSMEKALLDALPNYRSAGKQRDESTEKNPVFYHQSLHLTNQLTLWYNNDHLSETIVMHQDATFPRNLVIAEFDSFVFVNTHLSHGSYTARLDSVKLLTNYLKKQYLSKPIILTGDFNQPPNDDFGRALTTNLRLHHGFDLINDQDHLRTFHDFEGDTLGKPIDYIYIEHPFIFKSFKIDHRTDGDIYLSDHFPLIADIE